MTQVSSLCQDSASNTYAYKPAGRMITTTLALTGGEVAVTVGNHEALGQVITQTSALGRQT